MFATEKKVRYCGQFRGGLFCTKLIHAGPLRTCGTCGEGRELRFGHCHACAMQARFN